MNAQTNVIVALPGAQFLDVSGPLGVFAEANVWAGYPACHRGHARADYLDQLGNIENAAMNGSLSFHRRSR